MIAHRNVIANVLQIATFEKSWRDTLGAPGQPYTDVGLGLLPQSHIYALVVICHTGTFRGDQTIVLPKFEINSYLRAIQDFKIASLFLVRDAIPGKTGSLLILPGPSYHHQHAAKPRGLRKV